MSILESLTRHKDEALGLIVSNGGFSIALKNGKLSGYDSLLDQDREFIEKHRIPTVIKPADFSSSASLMLPLIGTSMDEGPINSMSRVPFEVYANICAFHGAQIINVKPIKFLPAMFGRAKSAYVDAMNAFIAGDNGALATALLKNEQEPDPRWSIPNTPALNVFHRSADQIAHTRTTHEKAAASLEQKCRIENAAYFKIARATDFKDVPKKNYDTFTEQLAQQSMAGRCTRLINIVTWNALMVEAGNFTGPEAWDAIGDYSDFTLAASKALIEKHDIESYSHLHKEHELLKPLHAWTQQLCKAAGHIAQRDIDTDNSAPAP